MPSFGEKRRQEHQTRREQQLEDAVEKRTAAAYQAFVDDELSVAASETAALYLILEHICGTEYLHAVKLRDFGSVTRSEWSGHSVRRFSGSVQEVSGSLAVAGAWDSLTGSPCGERLVESLGASAREIVVGALESFERVAVGAGLLPESVGRTYTLGEDFEESPLHEMYRKRERQGRSLQVIIVARDNQTGTGKTTLAVGLCELWGDEWTADNATNDPAEYRDFLNNKPEGSVLLADEIGQMYDSRRSMSSENVEVSQDWQMIRTKEYKTLSTLPGPSFLDKRLKKLSDVMIVCTRRGHARVYRTKVDDDSGDLWREHLCNVEWGALDDDPEYQAVEEMKRDRLAERFGDGEDARDELTQQDIEAAERETRDEIVKALYAESDLTQQEIAQATDLSRSRVGDIVSGD